MQQVKLPPKCNRETLRVYYSGKLLKPKDFRVQSDTVTILVETKAYRRLIIESD